jgi:hypothetical protein
MHHRTDEDKNRLITRLNQILDMSEYDEAIVVDNSLEPIGVDLPCKYVWMNGENTLYGGGINEAVTRLKADNVIYFSVKRGEARAKSWVDELTAPLDDPKCGMAGTLDTYRLSVISSDLDKTSDVYIQGGVWAARREVIERHPYPPNFLQSYSDVWTGWKLQKAGYRLCDVPSIKSVWAKVIGNPTRYSFFVDYREHWVRYA